MFPRALGRDCGLCGEPLGDAPVLYHPATCDKVVHLHCHSVLVQEIAERSAAEAAALDLLAACRMAAVSARFALLPGPVQAAVLAAIEKATPAPAGKGREGEGDERRGA